MNVDKGEDWIEKGHQTRKWNLRRANGVRGFRNKQMNHLRMSNKKVQAEIERVKNKSKRKTMQVETRAERNKRAKKGARDIKREAYKDEFNTWKEAGIP